MYCKIIDFSRFTVEPEEQGEQKQEVEKEGKSDGKGKVNGNTTELG